MSRYDDRANGAPLILDSGCGTGYSTLLIANMFPDHYVIGIDRSEFRLQKTVRGGASLLPDNIDFVRADLVDYWRLLYANSISVAYHYLLYPNPWPKIGHVSRRWHGHPVFPTLLALGGVLECRSNWKIYIDEFGFAVKTYQGILEDTALATEIHKPIVPWTPFELKYLASGHTLYRASVRL